MKILVTGCVGFIGSNLTSKLLNAGHKVVGLDNLSNPSINPTDRIKAESGKSWKNFKFFKKDIRDYDAFYEVLLHEKPQAIVHLAAMGSVPYSFNQPVDFYDVNCRGFATVVQCARDLGIRRIVYASSSSVYGSDRGEKRIEGREGEPLSPYAISKLQNELHAHVWGKHNKMQMIGLRFFNVYGPGQNYTSKFSPVIPQWLNNSKIRMCGDAERDYTYVDDVCEAISLSIESKNYGFVANVGTGVGTLLSELLTFIGDDKEIEPAPARNGDVERSIASTVNAEELLGFKAKVMLGEGIERTKQYYESLRA